MRRTRDDAERILDRVLHGYRTKSYSDLVALIESGPITHSIESGDQTDAIVDVSVFWDDREGEAVRVMATLHSGGLRAIVPFCRDFILAADGSFVGE